MKVLQVHSVYRSSVPSGENRTVAAIGEAISLVGIENTSLYMPTDEISTMPFSGKLSVGLSSVGSRQGKLSAAITESRPDVVLLHNPIPFVSPGELKAVREHVPVVHVIHNFRHSCIAGSHFRLGDKCTFCSVGKLGRFNGVARRCYRGSILQSCLQSASESAYSGVWRSLDGYVAISSFMKSYLISSGFTASSIKVIPNPILETDPIYDNARDVLFAGRLSSEKGMYQLVAAWRRLGSLRAGRLLHIAGTGPEEADVRDAIASDTSIVFHGLLSAEKLDEVGRRCAISVIPSTWDEPFGRVAGEAISAGRFIIVSSRGGLPEIATDPACSIVVTPDERGLVDGITYALDHVSASNVKSSAIQLWRSNFSAEVVGERYKDMLKEVLSK